MKPILLVCACVILCACGQSSQPTASLEPSSSPVQTEVAAPTAQKAVVAPIAEYSTRNTLKHFGDYVHDRFTGYHVGDDIEYTDSNQQPVPVYSIATGVVEYKDWVSGYGGFIRLRYVIDDQTIHALYGHIALDSSALVVGDQVQVGQFLANLGRGQSTETDGERKHLHFGLYAGTDARLNGYEQTERTVVDWINPTQFLEQHGVPLD